MTKVDLTLRSAYLAGPMRGIEDYNFPEFHKQAAWLRGLNWKVFSPAERDEADPAIDPTVNVAGWQGERGLDYFMAHDLKAVCEMDAVICLPGWEDSQGARLETATAVEIGHPVFEIVYDDPHGTRVLQSVDPSYIRHTFYFGGQDRDEPVDVPREHLLSRVSWYDAVEEDRAAMGIHPGPEDVAFDQGAMDTPAEVIDQMERESWEESRPEDAAMRAFETGATRNKEVDPDIYGFTSPLALGLFAEYMHKNRTQADGTLRDSDNWKKGIPLDSYIRSMRRHLQDLTLIHDGYPDLARESIEDALGGLFFNVQGYMHEAVKARLEEDAREETQKALDDLEDAGIIEWRGEGTA